MKLVHNDLIGKYACPDHPITCANPAPWLIIEYKIHRKFNASSNKYEVIVWIRGEESIWFNANSCFIDDLSECLEYLDMKERKNEINIELSELPIQYTGNKCEKCKKYNGIIRQVSNSFDLTDVYYSYFCDECNKTIRGL